MQRDHSDDIRTIDDVIQRLTEIIARSKEQQSRLGYFAALYRKVTIHVKQQIDAGDYFDDNPRMERLDVTFASRYLHAFDQMQSDERPTQSWEYAFEVSGQWWPIVLQHLLLGMNAHINLDLGIAAVQTVGAAGLPSLQADFNRINELLAGLVGDVKRELAWVWPPLRWLNRNLGGIETSIINFSMSKARDAAWSFAEELAPLDEAARSSAIARRDEETLQLAHLVRHPGFFLSTINTFIRIGERGSVSRVISVLE